MNLKLSFLTLCAAALGLGASAQVPAAPASDSDNPEWQQIDAYRLGQLDPHALVVPYANGNIAGIADMQYDKSPYFKSLNGNWKFKWAANPNERPKGFQEPTYDVSKWEEILVPADWQTQGYGTKLYVNTTYEFDSEFYNFPKNPPLVPTENNEVGSYRRSFTVPADWDGRRVVLACEGARVFYYIWVNGHYLGLNQDSKTAAEWDITDVLVPGQNTVAIEIYRWASGSYIECQDMWRMSGIDRDIYLYSTPKTYVSDFTVRSPLDTKEYKTGLFSVDIDIDGLPQAAPQQAAPAKKKSRKAKAKTLPAPKPYQIGYKLYAADGTVVKYGKAEAKDSVKFSAEIPDVMPWNAEHPYLYTLALDLYDPAGQVIETLGCNVGFRISEVRGSDFLVNGKRIMVKGVNRHSFDQRGHYVTPENELKDVTLMKENNINFVRNCHYPASRNWYHLADKYGLYVVDEANIEGHGMGYGPEAMAKKADWIGPFMDRTERMWAKSKNNPSVTIYSLGNETGNGSNFEKTYAYLKSIEPNRPVWCERALDDANSDIYGEMYAPISYQEKYAKNPEKRRPYIQIEYAHAMGNSVGGLKDYWDFFETTPKMQGGLIWDWVDQAFIEKDPKTGVTYFTYGGDYGPENIPSDDAFCTNGLINSDRTPHPHIEDVKANYQYAKVKPVDMSLLRFNVKNWHDFTNLNAYTLMWRVVDAEGKVYAKGTKTIDLAPGANADFALGEALPMIPETHPELFVDLVWVQNQRNGLLPRGFQMAYDQFEIPSTLPAAAIAPLAKIKGKKDVYTDKLQGIEFAVSPTTGELTSLKVGGNELLATPVALSLYRPLTLNDAAWAGKGRLWKKEGLNDISQRATSVKLNKNVVTVNADILNAEGKQIGTAAFDYALRTDRTLGVNVKFSPDTAMIKNLPRVGLTFRMPQADCPQFTFVGADRESYVDRETRVRIARHQSTPALNEHRYIVPQANGNHTQTREVDINDGMMVITSPALFQFSINPYDDKNVDNARHINELVDDGLVTVHLDAAQTGVGTATCGPDVLPKYYLPISPYDFSFNFKLK